MSLKDSLKKATNAAGIAAATSGLSTCHSGGGTVVDPAPPPLICTSVSSGQTLRPSVRKDGDDIVASVRVFSTGEISSWQITRVGDVVGAAVVSTGLPASVADSLVVRLRPASPAMTQIDFTVDGVLTGFPNTTCTIKRTFHVTIAATGVQIAETNLDALPLSARHAASIAVLDRSGRTVSLEARTGYTGPHRVSWDVSGGALDTSAAARVQWTLPNVPGIYQAEVLLDYGADGIAFETLVLEVVGSGGRQD
jgi:hypothetical protein